MRGKQGGRSAHATLKGGVSFTSALRPGEHVRPGGEIQFSKRPAITRNSRLGEAVRPRYAQLVKSTPVQCL